MLLRPIPISPCSPSNHPRQNTFFSDLDWILCQKNSLTSPTHLSSPSSPRRKKNQIWYFGKKSLTLFPPLAPPPPSPPKKSDLDALSGKKHLPPFFQPRPPDLEYWLKNPLIHLLQPTPPHPSRPSLTPPTAPRDCLLLRPIPISPCSPSNHPRQNTFSFRFGLDSLSEKFSYFPHPLVQSLLPPTQKKSDLVLWKKITYPLPPPSPPPLPLPLKNSDLDALSEKNLPPFFQPRPPDLESLLKNPLIHLLQPTPPHPSRPSLTPPTAPRDFVFGFRLFVKLHLLKSSKLEFRVCD